MEFEFEAAPIQPPQPSTFVNVLAWIFIVLAGFTTCISILQNIMIHTLFPREEMQQAMQQAEHNQQIPPYFEFMFNHFDLFFAAFLVISATTFIAAIALLKRKNWARILFIGLMALGIAWNVAGLVLQFTLFSSFPDFAGAQAPPPEFQSVMQIMRIASVVMVLAFCSLFGFIIAKLCSKKIRAEFV